MASVACAHHECQRAAAAAAGATMESAAQAQARQRALTAVLDVARIVLTSLVRGLAERLGCEPGSVMLAALEVELRDALLALGASLLPHLVRLRGTGYRGPVYVCPCGVRLRFKEYAALQQRTWFGTVTVERAVYAGAGCGVRAHHVPLDAAWGLLGAAPVPATLPDPDGGPLVPVAPGEGPARLAPAFAAVVVEFGARLPYREAAGLLALALGAGARLAPTTIRAYTAAAGRARQQQEDAQRVRAQPPSRGERRAVLDTTGTMARPAAAPAVLAISIDGALERTRAGWKEVKLGAIYDLVTQPVRQAATAAGAVAEASAALAVGAITYTATFAPAADFGRQVLAAAQRRGLRWAAQVVVLGDGAKWIWKLAARRFPGASQIVDWYHARAHLWALAEWLYGEGTAAAWMWVETLSSALWAAQTEDDVAVVAAAAAEAWAATTPLVDGEALPRRTQQRQREVAKEVAYVTGNAARLCYGHFRAQGLPVGSGVVEGGCQSVLHVRLKRPGARWGVQAAEYMVRARAVLCSDLTSHCSHPLDHLAS